MELSREIRKAFCNLCTEKHCCRGICVEVNNALVKAKEKERQKC